MKSLASKKYFTFVVLISLSLVVSIAILTAGWSYLLSISKGKNQMLTAEKNATNEYRALQDLAIRYRKVQISKSLLLESVPADKDVAEFILGIEDSAKNNSLLVDETLIGDKSKSKNVGNNLSQTVKKNDYNELQIHYTMTGSYAKFVNFLNDVSKIRRLNKIYDLNIVSDQSKTKETPDAVRAEFTLLVYVKSEK